MPNGRSGRAFVLRINGRAGRSVRIDALYDALRQGAHHPDLVDEIGRRLGKLVYAGEGGDRLRDAAEQAELGTLFIRAEGRMQAWPWGWRSMRYLASISL